MLYQDTGDDASYVSFLLVYLIQKLF